MKVEDTFSMSNTRFTRRSPHKKSSVVQGLAVSTFIYREQFISALLFSIPNSIAINTTLLEFNKMYLRAVLQPLKKQHSDHLSPDLVLTGQNIRCIYSKNGETLEDVAQSSCCSIIGSV